MWFSIDRDGKISFFSLISSLGRNYCFPFCVFGGIHLEKVLPESNLSVLTTQSNALNVVKNLGTCAKFRKTTKGKDTVFVSIFSDAVRLSDHGQLLYISGLLICTLSKDSIFYFLSWMSRKSKRLRSIYNSEILAVSEAINKGKNLKYALSTLIKFPVRVVVLVD